MIDVPEVAVSGVLGLLRVVGLREIGRAGCVGKDGEGGGGIDRAGVKLVPRCCRLL